MNARAFDRRNAQHDAAIVEEQRVAGAHILGQIHVVEADGILVAEFAFGIEYEFRARHQGNFVVLEFTDADLRALQIHQHAHRTSGAARQHAHQLDTRLVLGCSAMREIHAHHIETGVNHARERFGVAGGGAQRGYNFSAACHFF